MEIVPTSASKRKAVGLEILLNRKAELKDQIKDQKILITEKTQDLFTPTSLTNYLFRSFNKGLNVIDAVLMGYKIVKSIRTLWRKFK
ncbi:MAG: hypothetical protein PHT07_12650 [Paludibacter sp.]|nr:hypothetical protein [Paludibacter sp.]